MNSKNFTITIFIVSTLLFGAVVAQKAMSFGEHLKSQTTQNLKNI